MKPLRIAHLFQSVGINFHDPQAAQLHIYHTIRGLKQAGHQVSLVGLQGRRSLVTDDLRVFECQQVACDARIDLQVTTHPAFRLIESSVRRAQRVAGVPYLGLFDSLRMFETCLQELRNYQVLHERYNLLAVGGAMASRRLRIPLVLEVNADLLEQRRFKGAPETGLRRIVAESATCLCFQTAARIVCVSEDLKQHLMSKWGLSGDKVVVVPCAADADAFETRSGAKSVRRQLGLGCGEPTVMWIGGFYKWHDLHVLLESFALVVQSVPTAKLVLVGDGETKPQVKAQIARMGLDNSVVLTGAVPHARVPELLGIADIAVAPSPPVSASQGGTGVPLKLFEYMAAGLPIVASATRQAKEILQDGVNGVLVEPGDRWAHAHAVVELLNDPAKREQLGRRAHAVAREQHSWEHYTRQLEAVYASVLSDG